VSGQSSLLFPSPNELVGCLCASELSVTWLCVSEVFLANVELDLWEVCTNTHLPPLVCMRKRNRIYKLSFASKLRHAKPAWFGDSSS
jgi:hypothetical protein